MLSRWTVDRAFAVARRAPRRDSNGAKTQGRRPQGPGVKRRGRGKGEGSVGANRGPHPQRPKPQKRHPGWHPQRGRRGGKRRRSLPQRVRLHLPAAAPPRRENEAKEGQNVPCQRANGTPVRTVPLHPPIQTISWSVDPCGNCVQVGPATADQQAASTALRPPVKRDRRPGRCCTTADDPGRL